MKETGILFTPENIRAIRDGRKTQTRRAVVEEFPHGGALTKITPIENEFLFERWPETYRAMSNFGRCSRIKCPYGTPGDRLYVKEGIIVHVSIPQLFGYYMDGCRATEHWEKRLTAMFMPKWAARTWLEITEVRAERLHDISEEDAKAEGAEFFDGRPSGHHGWRHDPNLGVVWETAKQSYQHLWDSINAKKHPWSSNPWCWVITFKQIQQPGGKSK